MADRSAQRLLERPRVQALWSASVERAHRRLVQVLDDDLTAVNTEGGFVVLNLRPLVIQVGEQVAIVGDLDARLPDDAGRVRIMKADQLETAQDLTQLFKQIAVVLGLVPLLLWAGAFWLGRGRRRAILRTIAIGLIASGLLVLIVRKYGGDYVVDALVKSDAVRPAAHDTWDIVTALLADGAWTLIGLGLVAVLGLWLSGPSSSGVAVRAELAPFLARPEIVFPTTTVLFLLVILWGPTAQTHRLSFLVVAALLLALGVELLRREVLREYPNARSVELGASARSTLAKVRGAPPAAVAEDARLESLERLARLREQGVLTDAELASEKSRVLAAQQ